VELQEAIEAHLAWKHRFFSALRSADREALNAKELRSFEACPLGRWIQGCFENQAVDLLLVKLRDDHRELHRLAAALGNPAAEAPSATQLMLMEGHLQELSERILESLRLLKLRGRTAEQDHSLESPES